MRGSTADTLFILIPFVIVMLVGMFRLDQVFISSSRKSKPKRGRPRFAGFDESGRMVLTDPDGRVAKRDQPK